MKPAPLSDMADAKAWEARKRAKKIARHGEREKAERELSEFAHDLLRRDVAAKERRPAA